MWWGTVRDARDECWPGQRRAGLRKKPQTTKMWKTVPIPFPLKGVPRDFRTGPPSFPKGNAAHSEMWLEVPMESLSGNNPRGCVWGFFSVHPSRVAESEAPGREPGRGRLLPGTPHTHPLPPRITICWAVFLFIKRTLSFKLRLLLPWGSQREHSLYRKAQISPREHKVCGQHFPVSNRMEGA